MVAYEWLKKGAVEIIDLMNKGHKIMINGNYSAKIFPKILDNIIEIQARTV